MIYSKRSKISGIGVFTDRMIRPGIPVDTEDVARFRGFNHSCDPNCMIVRTLKGGNAGTVIALRFIKKGEELTLDYRTGDRRKLHPASIMKRPPWDCRPCMCPACRRKR